MKQVGERGLTKDQAWGRVSEGVGKEEAELRVSVRKKWVQGGAMELRNQQGPSALALWRQTGAIDREQVEGAVQAGEKLSTAGSKPSGFCQGPFASLGRAHWVLCFTCPFFFPPRTPTHLCRRFTLPGVWQKPSNIFPLAIPFSAYDTIFFSDPTSKSQLPLIFPIPGSS